MSERCLAAAQDANRRDVLLDDAWTPSSRSLDSFNAADIHTLSDEAIMSCIAERRKEAFEELHRRYRDQLFSYLCFSLFVNAETAEDVVQQTFLQVHLKCHSFRACGKVRPWLYAIARHQVADLLKKKRRRRIASLDQRIHSSDDNGEGSDVLGDLFLLDHSITDPLDALIQDEESANIRFAVSQLTAPMRRVIELVYFQRMEYREAADTLNIPIGTVKSRLHTAIEKLGMVMH